jgi:hypothetical protein
MAEEKCPLCITSRPHTKEYDRIHSAILTELNHRGFTDADAGELATALSVLVADALELNVYE